MPLLRIKNNRKNTTPTPRRRLSDSDSLLSHSQTEKSMPISFRRNTTITGSRSGSVRSASELGGNLQSPRAQAHHLRRKQRSLSALFAGSMLVVVSLVLLIQQFSASVSTTIYGQIGGMNLDKSAQYVDSIQQYLNGRPAQRIRAFLDSEKLVSYLHQAGYSEIATVESVTAAGIGKTHISLKVREPVASWTTGGVKRYVDREGTIFSSNYFDEPTVQIVDKSGISLNVGSPNVTSSRFLAFVGQAVGLFEDQAISVKQVVIPASGTRQVEFVLANKNTIKMTVDRGVGVQVEDAGRAWQHLSKEGEKVEYIDVRVSGQAYYK